LIAGCISSIVKKEGTTTYPLSKNWSTCGEGKGMRIKHGIGEQGKKRRSCIPITKEDNTELLKSKHGLANYRGLPTLLPSGAEVTVITQRVNLLYKR